MKKLKELSLKEQYVADVAKASGFTTIKVRNQLNKFLNDHEELREDMQNAKDGATYHLGTRIGENGKETIVATISIL